MEKLAADTMGETMATASLPLSQWREPAKDTPAQAHIKHKLTASVHRSSCGSIVTEHTALVDYADCEDDEHELRQKRAHQARHERGTHLKVLERFKPVVRNLVHNQSHSSHSAFSTSPSNASRKLHPPKLAKDDLLKLVNVAHNAFPPRMELPVLVCDVTKDRGFIYEIQLKDIERCWKKRPDEVIVRWIHAPLGHGVVHSSIEDMFRHDHPRGRAFRNAGHPEFPYCDLDAVQLRHTDELNHMRHVHEELHKLEDVGKILSDTCLDNDRNTTFRDDVEWRLKHLGRDLDFWDTVLGDVPLELTESFSSGGGEGPLRPPSLGKGALDYSMLAHDTTGTYRNAHLVWTPFRCFHRSDGTLLTMSAATGVDLLHRDVDSHLTQTPLDRLQNPAASVIGRQMKFLKDNGTKGWYRETVEYFLVHLLTEIGITPHNTYSGHSAPSVLSVLQSAIRDLKKRRFESRDPKEGEHLVKEYIHCLDELRALCASYQRRSTFFEHLARDVRQHEEEDRQQRERSRGSSLSSDPSEDTQLKQGDVLNQAAPVLGATNCSNHDKGIPDGFLGEIGENIDNPIEMAPMDCIERALRMNRRHKGKAEALIEETTQALQAFFHLRAIEQNQIAIEQNDRAINNESRSYAIFIFTGFTVVFLPLSCFCSYFGMNIKGIKNSQRNERFFWEICGTVTAIIISMIILCAFGKRFLLTRMANVFKRRQREKDVELGAP